MAAVSVDSDQKVLNVLKHNKNMEIFVIFILPCFHGVVRTPANLASDATTLHRRAAAKSGRNKVINIKYLVVKPFSSPLLSRVVFCLRTKNFGRRTARKRSVAETRAPINIHRRPRPEFGGTVSPRAFATQEIRYKSGRAINTYFLYL